MLYDYIEVEKTVTVEQVNHGLSNFKYGHWEVKDRPSAVEINHIINRKLRQSAAQI